MKIDNLSIYDFGNGLIVKMENGEEYVSICKRALLSNDIVSLSFGDLQKIVQVVNLYKLGKEVKVIN